MGRTGCTTGLFVAFFLTAISLASAATAPFYWEYINVDIDVQDNGDMLITETQKYVFTGPHNINQLSRWISPDNVDAIIDVKVVSDSREIPDFTEIEDNRFLIRWPITFG